MADYHTALEYDCSDLTPRIRDGELGDRFCKNHFMKRTPPTKTRLQNRPKTNGSDFDTGQLLAALMAFKRGDFSTRLPDDWTGVPGKIADTFNAVIETNHRMTQELEHMVRVVGKEGRISQRASLGEVSNSWADAIQCINVLIGDLVQPTSETARVIGAVAKGDLSQTMATEIEGRPLKGEFLHTAKTVNAMVGQLGAFASEVTRVAREVGTEGKLGGQAKVKGVAGTWKDLTENVNLMASNLTSQVRNIAAVTTAVANGDLTKKITVDVRGELLGLKDTINKMVDQLRSFASEVTRVAREVGTEGKLGGQAKVEGVSGTWKDLTDKVNLMASNLTVQLRDMSKVATAIAGGDLTQKITVDVRGEILQIKNVINTMVDQLSSFASEVTRVAREVGTEGKLGGQAAVGGVAGTWKDLTDSVNSMASNLTAQVRNIAEVVTAVANGNLKRKLFLEAKGEIAELAETINNMIDTLATFAEQVTTVAREVGVQGKLGGQASVPGAAGTWRDLTDNVNGLAANLTSQLRAIADVATAVTKGDLTRSIQVEAQGEVAFVKDNINEMIRNLRDTTLRNEEQDWLKTRKIYSDAPGTARFSDRRQTHSVRTRTVGIGTTGRILHGGQVKWRIRAQIACRLCSTQKQRSKEPFQAGRGFGRASGFGKAAPSHNRNPKRLRKGTLRPRRISAEEHSGAPDFIRGGGKSSDGTFVG